MIINRNNYKTYFLDFWEASLEEKDKTALLLFLEKNPDLQNEFLDFKAALDITIPRVTHLEFPNKKDLKKVEIQSVGEINQMNWENWVIAHLEGELTFEQEQAYQNFVKANPQVETEIDLYRKAFLKLDKSIVFPYKSELKRRQIPILSFGRVKAWQAVAAVLAIAFALYQIVDFSALSESENPIVVQNDTPSSLNTTVISEDFVDTITINFYENPVLADIDEGDDNIEIESATPYKEGEMKQNLFQNKEIIAAMKRLDMLFPNEIHYSSIDEMPTLINRSHISNILDDLLIHAELADAGGDEKFFKKAWIDLKNIFTKDEKPLQELINPAFNSFVQGGKDILARVGEILPVVNRTDNEDNTEVAFAFGDSFGFRISRSKNKE